MRAASAQFHFYTLNRAELSYAICHLLGLQAARTRHAVNTAEQLRAAGRGKRILITDGAFGTEIQTASSPRPIIAAPSTSLATRRAITTSSPDPARRVREITRELREAGSDIVSTNTFNANRISQADYGAEHLVRDINLAAGADRREVADERRDGRPRFVAGAIGPTNKTLSLSPDVNDPGYREIDFDSCRTSIASRPRR